MANEEHLTILKQGADVWNRWRKDNIKTIPDLTWADLREIKYRVSLEGICFREMNLTGANLSYLILDYADFRGAKLYGTQLIHSRLWGANLNQADLIETHFEQAELCKADLQEANLWKTDLQEAGLDQANMLNSTMGLTVLVRVDLSKVSGLETVNHRAPSFIGIDTIYMSEGKIPEVFLRGAGVPESFIAHMSTLTHETIGYHSCFISYSTKDQLFAERIHADLQANGVRCWFAPEDIKGGRKLHDQIPEAIKLYDKLLLVLSEHSINSEWVKTEIYHARQDEIRNNKRKLFPIGLVDYATIHKWEAFDADVGKDMAREIREYFIPDFSNWKDYDAYDKALRSLIRDLRKSEQVENGENVIDKLPLWLK